MGAFLSRLIPGGGALGAFGGNNDHGIAGRARKYHIKLDPRMDSTSPTGEASVHDDAMKESALNATVYPPASFVNNAHVSSLKQYNDMYRESVDRPAKFWGKSLTNCTGTRRTTRASPCTPSTSTCARDPSAYRGSREVRRTSATTPSTGTRRPTPRERLCCGRETKRTKTKS
ncbi:acetyl-coenzyme A synthetase [Pycnococcus provasolii]